LQQQLYRVVDERDNAMRERDNAVRERNEALRERDQVLSRLVAMCKSARQLVFYHIPRTGGSSIWHALEACAARAGMPVLNLFYHAREDYGSPEYVYNVLTERQKYLQGCSTLIHLHTPHNISYFFEECNLTYATIVRDPVDRFISDICHLRRALPDMADAERQNLITNGRWQSTFADAMLDGNTPIGILLELGAQEPFFRDYYYHQFYGLLCQKPLPQITYQLPNGPEDIRTLAEQVRTKFAYIGQFPQVADSYHRIADLFSLPYDRDAEFTFHINKLDSHQIVPDRHERFAAAFQPDYDLLSALGITFTGRN
jgi:hypothetical protein